MPPVTNTQTPVATPPVVPANTPIQLFPQPQTLLSNVEKEITSIEKDWKSPGFWIHLAIQVATWVGFLSTTSNTIKIGTLTLSATSLISYLYHLTNVNKP